MKKILVCIDGSRYGQVCCQYAFWFAHKTHASVDVLYVSENWQYEAPLIADFGGSLGAQPYMGLTEQLRQVEAEKAGVLGGYVNDMARKEGIAGRVAVHHRTGSLVDCITEFESEMGGAGLVIIGKRGEGANMATAHLGSNMERVVRASPLPCFVANREFFEPRKILIAYDGSASADKAVAWFGVNRAAFAGAELHVVSVARHGEEAHATDRLAVAEQTLLGFHRRIIAKVLPNASAADAIAHYQQSQGINFLLMGAYGHSRIRRLLIGSTTTEIIQRCLVPVVLFR
ncbi:MAG: universal stress protein [Puniceicoccales bacterium]|jgi:nucleotide-binding universal stress UspA family protein|nr:universal stress protein [Puniceicoccales bacterium]